MRIVAISGSLQRSSTNTDLLRLAQREAPSGIDIAIYPSLGDVPPFNPDLEGEAVPDPVATLRAGLCAADSVLIATPEYAHGLPGVLKNALDWVVGSGELYGMPVAVLCASPRLDGGERAREWLVQTLRAQGARTISSSTVQVRRSLAGNGMDDPAVVDAVTAALEMLRDAVASSGSEVLAGRCAERIPEGGAKGAGGAVADGNSRLGSGMTIRE